MSLPTCELLFQSTRPAWSPSSRPTASIARCESACSDIPGDRGRGRQGVGDECLDRFSGVRNWGEITGGPTLGSFYFNGVK
jgi:hypothetical protein